MGKPVQERIREFVHYHKTGDGECNGILMKAYADKHRMNTQQRFDFAFFYATVYCIPSAIIMLNEKAEIIKNPSDWAKNNKSRLIFQSDRRYARLNGAFERMLKEYADTIHDADRYIKETVSGDTISVKKALGITTNWYFFGRFGAFLFIETLCLLMSYKSANAPIQWKDGDTATSGLMNLFAFDNSAEYFDKHDKLPPNFTQEKLDILYGKLISAIRRAGGETNVTEVETSLCAYRKFYKGSRYNGYYLDRQLEELKHYESQRGAGVMVQELYSLRKSLFDHRYLGEIHGWEGVRKECKTLYKRTGQMM